jgi:hypothetical protein
MRGISKQRATLKQRLIDKANVALRQVSNSPVHEFCAPAGGTLGEIGLFKQNHSETPGCRVKCHPETGGAAANDDYIKIGLPPDFCETGITVKRLAVLVGGVIFHFDLFPWDEIKTISSLKPILQGRKRPKTRFLHIWNRNCHKKRLPEKDWQSRIQTKLLMSVSN